MTTTKLNPRANISMTRRVGTFLAKENDLVAVLGKPHEENGDKTTKEWFFQTPVGVATLYDYYWNASDEWSIGGRSVEVVNYVTDYLVARLRPDV